MSQESEIRPDGVEDRYRAMLHAEITEHFFDSADGGPKHGVMVEVDCPACGRNRPSPYLTKQGFAIVKCGECELFYVNPRPSEEAQINFFVSSKAIGLYSEMVESTRAARSTLIFEPLVDRIFSTFGSAGGRLLEVGCGAGLLLDALVRRGTSWQIQGVEPNARAVEICRAKGLDVIHGSLESLESTASYDLVVFWAVFDHFFDPCAMVKKAADLLRPGGSVLIGNMNVDGFESAMLGHDNPAFDPPERQNFFGKRSMTAMLERAGLGGVKIVTTGTLDVDIVRNYWKAGHGEQRSAFLERIVLGPDPVAVAFQQFLTQNGLSGHMTVTAVK